MSAEVYLLGGTSDLHDLSVFWDRGQIKHCEPPTAADRAMGWLTREALA